MVELTLQEQYTNEIGKLPNNKKNDLERIQNKLNEFRAGDAVDTTPDEDGNATPEEGMVTKAVEEEVKPSDVAPAEEKTIETIKPEVELSKKAVEHKTLLQIQSFYGISNEEMYNDNTLIKKYGLNKEELAVVRSYTQKKDSEFILNLNYHEMPDYIQVIFHKYGFTGETIRSNEAIVKCICGDKEPTEAQVQEIHQLNEFYAHLRKESLADDLVIKNPNLENPL